MKIIEEVEVDLEHMDLARRVPLVRPARLAQRSPGIHLSGVLRYVVEKFRMPGWERIEKELAGEEPRHLPLLFLLGQCWEEGVASLYPNWCWQPGEECMAGIWMTCDGYNFADQHAPFIEEAKWSSAKRKTGKELLDDWVKQRQGRGYCAGYGFQRVRWHCCWCWRPWAPEYVRYVVEFSEEEIAETRKMLINNRDAALAAGYGESQGTAA